MLGSTSKQSEHTQNWLSVLRGVPVVARVLERTAQTEIVEAGVYAITGTPESTSVYHDGIWMSHGVEFCQINALEEGVRSNKEQDVPASHSGFEIAGRHDYSVSR